MQWVRQYSLSGKCGAVHCAPQPPAQMRDMQKSAACTLPTFSGAPSRSWSFPLSLCRLSHSATLFTSLFHSSRKFTRRPEVSERSPVLSQPLALSAITPLPKNTARCSSIQARSSHFFVTFQGSAATGRQGSRSTFKGSATTGRPLVGLRVWPPRLGPSSSHCFEGISSPESSESLSPPSHFTLNSWRCLANSLKAPGSLSSSPSMAPRGLPAREQGRAPWT
mmetsp:Transcript_7761/g.16860  ORF Transcript_7761/g.16860 Transcript_7761/m.16860 type:complete len:222 (+) Transcript_7761:966-1631(+)